jgi:sugar phosphate permease
MASLAASGIFTTFMLRLNISPVATEIQGSLQITRFELGLALSAFLWVYTFLQPVAGWATDRWGAKLTMFAGLLASSIITILTGFATSLVALIVLRVALGVTQAPNFVTGAKVSSSGWYEQETRARATSIWIAGGRLGTVLTFPLAAALAVAFGWQWAFFGTGILGLIWCALWLYGYRDRTHPNPGSKVQAEPGPSLRERLPLLLNPLALGLTLSSFGQGYIAYYLNTWLPTYLIDQRKFTVLQAGFVSTLPFLAAIVTILLIAGLFSDYMVRKGASPVGLRSRLFSIGMIGVAAMLLVTAYTPDSYPYLAIVSLSLAGAAWGLATPSLWAALVEATPKHLTGSMAGIQNLGGNLGGIIVITATGYILTITNNNHFFALVSASAAALLAALSAFVLVKLQSQTRSLQL